MPQDLDVLEARREELKASLAKLGDMRQGSLLERYRKCGKTNCRCADSDTFAHGPSWSLTRSLKAKTVCRIIPERALAQTRQQLAEFQEFRRLNQALVEINERICETKLAGPADAAGTEHTKKELQAAFTANVIEEIEALICPGAAATLDFEAVEMAVRRRTLQVAARAVEQRLNADTCDYAGATLPCPCGSEARYIDRRKKCFVSVLGELALQRAYYYCAQCKAGFCPRDQALMLEGSSLSPAVVRMTGLVGATVSFEESRELLYELAGVELTTKHIERVAEVLGEEVAKDECELVEAPTATEAVPDTLYLGMDGTGIAMREEELIERPGKQPDGSAKTREVKLAVVWSAQGRDKEGNVVRDQGSVSYSAAIESAAQKDVANELSDFAKRVARESKRRGFDTAKRRVILGDGAAWIWNIAEELYPGAIQIVDRFHVKQHISDVAKAIYGTGTDLATGWARLCYAELDKGNIDNVIAAIDVHADLDIAKKCVTYLENNRERMRYAEFKAQGLCTSSGVVEAGCKVAIGTRLKRAGMHWTVRGANAIIALRSAKLSRNRFAEFWERRATRKPAPTQAGGGGGGLGGQLRAAGG